MNRFECIGNLTKDPELKTTTSGINVCRFSIAVNRKFKDKETDEYITDFFNVVAWRGLADTINKFCKKGSKVFLSGELQNRSYDADDGSKRYVTELIASDCEFLNYKDKEDKDDLKPVEDDGLPF